MQVDTTKRASRFKNGVSLFVDNITKHMSKSWLEDIFSYKSDRDRVDRLIVGGSKLRVVFARYARNEA